MEEELKDAFVRTITRILGTKEEFMKKVKANIYKGLENIDFDYTFEEFDDDFFRKVIEKVKVQSMVEVVFVFKTGSQFREVLE